jgi:hypothetical protein
MRIHSGSDSMAYLLSRRYVVVREILQDHDVGVSIVDTYKNQILKADGERAGRVRVLFLTEVLSTNQIQHLYMFYG